MTTDGRRHEVRDIKVSLLFDGGRHGVRDIKVPDKSMMGFDGKRYYVAVNPKTLAQLQAKGSRHD